MNIFVFFICYALRSYEQMSCRGLYETKSRITHGKSFSVKGQIRKIPSQVLITIFPDFCFQFRDPFDIANDVNFRAIIYQIEDLEVIYECSVHLFSRFRHLNTKN